MKKNIINFKPHLTPLPCKVSNFLDIALLKLKDKSGNQGIVIAVGGY